MNQKLVIISPCRDEAQFVESTLKSVVAQTRRPDLWIIVDDGSRDNTPELIRYLRRRQLFRPAHFNRLSPGTHGHDAL